MRYQVIKPMNGHQAGDVLSAGDFLNPRRVALLIEQHYIQPIDERETTTDATIEQVAMVVPKTVVVKRGKGRK